MAEDNNSLETRDMLRSYKSSFLIKHYSHQDIGNRKPKAINSAIKISDGEYVIFIDGDTIPFSTFIEYHVLLSSKNSVLCGRRVNLEDKFSKALRDELIVAKDLENRYLHYYIALKKDGVRHYEQGISFSPKSIIYKIISIFNENNNIVASNFSCFKDDILKVNGVDESLPYPPGRDDTDLQWRLEFVGIKMKSCKYSANLFHLNHSRDERELEYQENMKIINKKKENGEFWAKNGVF